MNDSDFTRRRGLTLHAVDPATGKLVEVMISHARMQAVAKRSLGHASECAYIVPKILASPTAIFEGLRHDADEDRTAEGWRCYCGIPEHAYHSDGTKRGAYRDKFTWFL